MELYLHFSILLHGMVRTYTQGQLYPGNIRVLRKILRAKRVNVCSVEYYITRNVTYSAGHLHLLINVLHKFN
jgi:hypothetical protein